MGKLKVERVPEAHARRLGTLRLDGESVASATDAVHRLALSIVAELRRARYATTGATVRVTIEPIWRESPTTWSPSTGPSKSEGLCSCAGGRVDCLVCGGTGVVQP